MSSAVSMDAYDDAKVFVDRALQDHADAIVGRIVGNRRDGQIALALAIATAAGNAVYHLTNSHERAERLHRERAAWHREKGLRRMAKGKRP